MFQWKTLRIGAGILLLLPLVHFTFMVATDMRGYLDPSPQTWDEELAALVKADTARALPSDPILVVGGQRVRLWQDLPARLQPRATLMRPLGDATLEDVRYHYDRLVGFYRPEILVIVPSYGDLHLRDNKNSDDFRKALRDLLNADAAYESTRRRYAIAPILMPFHLQDRGRISRMVEAGEALADEDISLVFIDPNPLLAAADGLPDPALFRADGINLNDQGYARLSLLLREAMQVRGDLALERVSGF